MNDIETAKQLLVSLDSELELLERKVRTARDTIDETLKQLCMADVKVDVDELIERASEQIHDPQ